MVEEEEGHDDEERGRKGISNYFLTLLGLVLFHAVRASFIFSKLHTGGIRTVCRGEGGGGGGGEGA